MRLAALLAHILCSGSVAYWALLFNGRVSFPRTYTSCCRACGSPGAAIPKPAGSIELGAVCGSCWIHSVQGPHTRSPRHCHWPWRWQAGPGQVGDHHCGNQPKLQVLDRLLATLEPGDRHLKIGGLLFTWAASTGGGGAFFSTQYPPHQQALPGQASRERVWRPPPWRHQLDPMHYERASWLGCDNTQRN